MYRRFLNNKDYLGIITQEALDQLTRGDETRFEQAEQAAEASIVDYLSESYEVEQELNRGKYIFDYDRKISYPIGSHFRLNGEICEVLQSINGYKEPSDIEYWKESEDFEIDRNTVEPYSQMKNYHAGDLVMWLNKLYECVNANGYDFQNIRIPSIHAWEQTEVYDWNAIHYNLWEVVKYNDRFFALISTENYDEIVNPMDSDCWGLIGDYDNSIDTYEISAHEYVVYNNKVYYPIINPNADAPELGKNYCLKDPRNFNLKRHMVQLSLYELHKLISPNNISTVRVNDYEHTMKWLKDASRLKINPRIPRKVDHEKKPVLRWQLATFQTSYDPNNNPWLI